MPPWRLICSPGRSFLTAVVVGVIALGTAYPVVTYIDQDREIKRINTHISQLQQENAQLKAEQTWWNDDNYVRQQARSRLYYVNPGDTPLRGHRHYRGLYEGGRYFCECEERPRGSLDY